MPTTFHDLRSVGLRWLTLTTTTTTTTTTTCLCLPRGQVGGQVAGQHDDDDDNHCMVWHVLVKYASRGVLKEMVGVEVLIEGQ